MLFRSLIGGIALLLVTGAACSAADGAAVYKAQCAKCHGDAGESDTTMGKAMKVPALAGDANVQKMPEADVIARIQGNAKHPPTIKALSADDVAAAAAYVKQLAGK